MFEYHHLPNKGGQTSLVRVTKKGHKRASKIHKEVVVSTPNFIEVSPTMDINCKYIPPNKDFGLFTISTSGSELEVAQVGHEWMLEITQLNIKIVRKLE